MNVKKSHSGLLKERLTILVVMFFCALISGSEYLVQAEEDNVKTEQSSQKEDASDENATFIHTAVDAVVPFVVVVLDHVFHLIYELVVPERQTASLYSNIFKSSNTLFEVLFEHIVSPNAP